MRVQRNLWTRLRDPSQLAPPPIFLSDPIPCSYPHTHSALAHSPFVVPTYAKQAPASECFCDLGLENSSLDIKALLSFCLQFPAQVSPYQRSLLHHALETRNPRTLQAISFLPYFIFILGIYQHLTKDVFVSYLFFMRREALCCFHSISNVLEQCPTQKLIHFRINPHHHCHLWPLRKVGSGYLILLVPILERDQKPKVLCVDAGEWVGEYLGVEMVRTCPVIPLFPFLRSCS